jgi:uncharacterized delta-60 repeat protein
MGIVRRPRYHRSVRRGFLLGPVVLAMLVMGTGAWAAPGEPDPAWSGDGLVTDALGVDATGVRVLVLGNNKVIVAGEVDEGGPSGVDVLLARYTAGGMLDTTFSGDGYRSIDLTNGIDSAWALARQSNGRYLVGGEEYGPNRVFVLRTLANGNLDPTFSGDGVATPTIPGYDGGFPWTLLVQPDGKVLAVGEAYPTGGGSDLMVLRFRPNGTLDPSFSGDGRLVLDVAGGEDTAWGAQLLGNGKILGIGTANTAADDPRVGVFRINANGTMDSTFSGDGVAAIQLGPVNEYGRGIFRRSDGKLVALAEANHVEGPGTDKQIVTMRLNPNGTLDTTFGGGDGKVFTNSGADQFSFYDVVRRSNGRMVLAGDGDGDFTVWQLLANGALDAGFGTGGMTVFDPEGGRANGVALTSSGRVVSTGAIGDEVATVRLLNT